MKSKVWVVLGAGIAVALLAVWGYVQGHKEFAIEQDREKPVHAPSRVVAEADGAALTLDADTQKRADIAIVTVQGETRRDEVQGLATVLPSQELIDLRNAYAAAETQANRAAAALDASHREYKRVKSLHGEEQNLSQKALDAAQAAWQVDEAAARGAREALDAVVRGARQKWGNVLTTAVIADSPMFRHLAEQSEVLLRMAISPRTAVGDVPDQVKVATDDGGFRAAKLISASPQADPRIQGATFLYIAPANGLLPGTTLTTYLPTGVARAGGIVPAAAVVWWQGKAWIYLHSPPDRFIRKELPAAIPIDGGWFAPGALIGAELVVRGAQTLLSEELRAQLNIGEDKE